MDNKYQSVVQKLKRRNSKTRQTGFESQFYLLSQVTPDPDDVFCNTARGHQNKNRSNKFLPRKNYCYYLANEFLS